MKLDVVSAMSTTVIVMESLPIEVIAACNGLGYQAQSQQSINENFVTMVWYEVFAGSTKLIGIIA